MRNIFIYGSYIDSEINPTLGSAYIALQCEPSELYHKYICIITKNWMCNIRRSHDQFLRCPAKNHLLLSIILICGIVGAVDLCFFCTFAMRLYTTMTCTHTLNIYDIICGLCFAPGLRLQKSLSLFSIIQCRAMITTCEEHRHHHPGTCKVIWVNTWSVGHQPALGAVFNTWTYGCEICELKTLLAPLIILGI